MLRKYLPDVFLNQILDSVGGLVLRRPVTPGLQVLLALLELGILALFPLQPLPANGKTSLGERQGAELP